MTRKESSAQPAIRIAQEGDSGAVAGLHQRELEGSFLAKLGTGFLTQMYGYLIEKEIVFVLLDGGRPVGFVSASLDSSGLMKRFVRHRPLSLVRIGFAVLRRPSLLKSVIETALAPSQTHDAGGETSPKAELLSIAVDRDQHRRGCASKLLTAMEARLRSLGVGCYRVVAGEKLDGANRFYKKSGFEVAGRVTIHGDELSNIYTKTI